jgi:hypothetical protein
VRLSPILPVKAQELWRALGGAGSVHQIALDAIGRIDTAGWVVADNVVLFPKREQP